MFHGAEDRPAFPAHIINPECFPDNIVRYLYWTVKTYSAFPCAALPPEVMLTWNRYT
jgi:hypothetical protein